MAEPFLDALKNVVPSLEKATKVNFLLLLTSFVLLADCAALYVHGMNILHLSDLPDIIKPRLAIEAVILVIGFGFVVGVVMPVVLIFANAVVTVTARKWWGLFVIWSDPDGRRFRPDAAYSVSVSELHDKAHASKESYYLNLLEEADKKETEHQNETQQTALLAFTVLVLSGVNVYAPLSPEGNGIVAQIADGLGQNGYAWLVCLGFILVMMAFYPMFEDRHPTVHCPELARELEKKRQEEREQLERFRQEAEVRASRLRPIPDDIGERLSNRTGGRSMGRNSNPFTPQKPDD